MNEKKKMKNKKEAGERKGLKIFGLMLIVIMLVVIGINGVSAADTLYWVGRNNGNWSDASSWASSSGGAGGAGIPNSTNGVVFDSANKNNSMINNSIAVYSINVSIGYNGTITQKMNWNY